MEEQALSKIIPAIVLLVLGMIESIGGLYFEDKRTKNDFTIELLSLITLPILIQPGIFLVVLWGLGTGFSGLEDYFISSSFSLLSQLKNKKPMIGYIEENILFPLFSAMTHRFN